MMNIVERFKNYIKVIDSEVDVNLEMAHIAYAEAKKEEPKILLFNKPVDKKLNKKYSMPVLMNLFANERIAVEILGAHPDEIAEKIENALKMQPPKNLKDKIDMFKFLFGIRRIFPKRSSKRGRCQAKEIKSLDDLPILKTWPKDGGKFITMGQVYTHSIDGQINNVGMYRLQAYGKSTLGMHWQIHKDSNHIFHQYKKANKKMPVTVAIGGDPLYSWCATAPLPQGIFELLLYGFIRNTNPILVKSLTNDIYVPENADIIIEGFVDPINERIEGQFGDHTGYYTPKEPYPVMEVTKITSKKSPIFLATVVGKPPLEDKYLGWITERVFLPLIRMQSPDLIDYKMPENGVFHNLILCRISPKYPGHSLQIMHSLWGSGQMSFVKHAVFVDEDAPPLTDYKQLADYVLNRLSKEKVLVTKGILDALDHSSPEALVGGKLGIDATGDTVEKHVEILKDNELFERMKLIDKSITNIKQYCKDSANPVTIIAVKKDKPVRIIFESLRGLHRFLSVVIFVDDINNVNNPYMLVWRIVNNIDALRDVWIDDIIGVDATTKSKKDGFMRQWPDDVVCDRDTFYSLKKKGLIDIDEKTIIDFQLL